MMFHVVTAAQCWLEVEGANSCHLRPGDLALVPHGEGHRLVGAAGVTAVKLFDAPRELVSDRYEILRHGGGGESTTVITRLADILVIQAIRSWIARDPAAQTGWLGALRDQQIGRAIALVHRDPARNWTVASLAMAVGMSRSAFAARFSQLVGEPAVRYVTRWKMHAALMWLKEENAALSEIASRPQRCGLAKAVERAFRSITTCAARRISRR
jgi:AraC-like DNA-binding protein